MRLPLERPVGQTTPGLASAAGPFANPGSVRAFCETSRMQSDLDLRVLEYIYDNDRGMSGGAGLAGLYEVAGGEDAAHRTAAGLRERGLIRAVQRLGGGYHIEAEGRRLVEETRARRADRGHRRAECREQLLRWADSGGRVVRRDFDGSIDGEPFSMIESERAAAFLVENGLLKSHSASGEKHFLIEITELGRECIDSGKTIQDFLRPVDRANQMLNIFGSGNNVAAAFGDNNEVSADLSAFNHDLAATLAASVRDALPVLALPGEVEDLLPDIEQRSDPTRAQRATARLYTLLGDTASSGLGGVLTVLAANALGIGS